jgi:hypothetical protein
MSEIRRPKMCGLFRPGHDPHWIQIHRSNMDKDNPPLPGRLVDSRSDGTFTAEVGQQAITFWNHDVDRLVDAIAAADGQLLYQESWHLLWVPNSSGRYAFCVAGDRHIACPDEPPSGTPVELLERAGGFTIRIGDLGDRGNEV